MQLDLAPVHGLELVHHLLRFLSRTLLLLVRGILLALELPKVLQVVVISLLSIRKGHVVGIKAGVLLGSLPLGQPSERLKVS